MPKFHFCCSQNKRNLITTRSLTRLEISYYALVQLVIYKLMDSDFNREHPGQPPCLLPSPEQGALVTFLFLSKGFRVGLMWSVSHFFPLKPLGALWKTAVHF